MWWKYLIEMFFSVGMFINAGLFVPQAIQLYRSKNSKNFSLLTFGGFNILQLLAVFHGLLNKDYILAIGFGLSLISCGVVTIMILVYKK